MRVMSKVYTLCFLMKAQLESIPEASRAAKYNAQSIENMFVYAMVWSFGGPLPEDKVNNYRRNFSKKNLLCPINFYTTTVFNDILFWTILLT